MTDFVKKLQKRLERVKESDNKDFVKGYQQAVDDYKRMTQIETRMIKKKVKEEIEAFKLFCPLCEQKNEECECPDVIH